MELIQPTSFASSVASSKKQLKNISDIVSKYLGKTKAENFLKACDELDFITANTILDDTVRKLTGYDSVHMALSIFANKFPQLSPELGNKVSEALSESSKINVIDSYYSKINKIIDGGADNG